MPTKTAKKSSARPTPASKPNKLAPGENPLVPHETLRQMYLKTLHARLLSEYLATTRPKAKARQTKSMQGQEACRASLVQGLTKGDLIAESQPGPVMHLLLGTKLSSLLGKSDAASLPPSALLPFTKEADDRLQVALGAAFVLKHLNRANLIVVFIEQDEAGSKLWRRTLTVAAQQNLPVLFVVLPMAGHDGHAQLTTIAHSSGVAGIAVEAADAIALYRVSQEAMGRIRSGGGPVLIEGIAYRPEPLKDKKQSRRVAPDPVVVMRECLLNRNAATAAWISRAEISFRKELTKAKPKLSRTAF